MATSSYEKPDHDLDTVQVGKTRTSGRKTILLVIGILILLSIGMAKVGSDVFYGLREPHSDLYENKTLAEVKELSDVVRPLVDRLQKFDIVATVWVRKLDPRDGASRHYAWIHEEECIFSNTVFRGVTLMDEHVHTKVNLSIPLATFVQAATLENFNIRATFKLIPQSPSPLDYITHFTTWVPATVVFPDISPESRNRKMKGDFSPPKTHEALKDAALESFAISVPLIDFHPIKSACGRVSEDSDGIEESFAELDSVVSTKGKSPLHRHPYVVTRTDLRVVRMDKIYNRKAYDSYHRELRSNPLLNGCSKAGKRGLRDGKKCIRRFISRGNCETRIELEVPDEKTGIPKKQVAYAPFISVNRRSWGPLDIVPMPVNRETCPEESNSKIPEFLHVTWNLAYSGSGGEKLHIARMLSRFNSLNATDTEFNKAKAQRFAEISQRVHGHKHSADHHIGRKLILNTIVVILSFIRNYLHFHYWYTRSTTVGISILGASLSALGFTLQLALNIWKQGILRKGKGIGIPSSLYTFIMALYWYLVAPRVVLKTERLRLAATNAFPYLKLLPASHPERASWRLETKGRKWSIIGILLTVFAFQFIDALRDFSVIPHLGPDQDPVPADSVIPKAIENYLLGSLVLSSTILQVTMNYRSKTFAGQYKVAAWIQLATHVIALLECLPWLAWGTASQFRNHYSLGDTVVFLLVVLFAAQGICYMNVPQDIKDESSNSKGSSWCI